MKTLPHEKSGKIVWAVLRKNGHIFEDVYTLCDTEETANLVAAAYTEELELDNRWGFSGYEVAPINIYKTRRSK